LTECILIVAGEPSGDNIGGLLAAELKLLRPELGLFGLGGDRMDVSGVEIRYHINQLSFLGFWEVIKHIPFLKRVRNDLLDQVSRRRPALAILIDYPGFNLGLAARLKAMKVPVMYYVSPQVWAWGKRRIGKIRKLVDKMVVVFQFEKEMYEEGEGVSAKWYGHPLLDIVESTYKREDFLKAVGLNPDARYIGLFPGSRRQEVERILPVMREAVSLLTKSGLSISGMVGCAPGLDDRLYREIGGDDLRYVRGLSYDIMRHAELNLVASGTATLECAILQSPLFVLYKTSALTYLLARRLISIPYIGLVNVVAGEKIVPEFIQGECRGDLIAGEIAGFLAEQDAKNRMTGRLSQLRTSLGEKGASRKVAEAALRMLPTSRN
jgi:lipid-A-disaccharide synthase